MKVGLKNMRLHFGSIPVPPGPSQRGECRVRMPCLGSLPAWCFVNGSCWVVRRWCPWSCKMDGLSGASSPPQSRGPYKRGGQLRERFAEVGSSLNHQLILDLTMGPFDFPFFEPWDRRAQGRSPRIPRQTDRFRRRHKRSVPRRNSPIGL